MNADPPTPAPAAPELSSLPPPGDFAPPPERPSAEQDAPAEAPPNRSSRWIPPPPEELGRLLPQFEIECLIGHGGMGAVYKALQLSLDRIVAIKLLPAEVASPDFVARFRREARMLARLQHPGIVA